MNTSPYLSEFLLRHYNAEMRLDVATWSPSKLFLVLMLLAGCVFAPALASAKGLFTQTSPQAKPGATDGSKSVVETIPSSPATQPITPAPPLHTFWDRTNLMLFSGIAVTRGLDYASTRNFQARGRQEILLPDDVVDNSAGFASLEVAATMASVGISYWLHRTGHHKLERWISIGHIGITAFGDVRNYTLESRHRVPMIRAMGGQFRIEAVFPEGKVEINQFRKLKKADGGD